MARSVEFNPLAAFVSGKSNELIIAGKKYKMGATIDKGTISKRKLLQLWSQGRIVYDWMLKKDNIAKAPEGAVGSLESSKEVDSKVGEALEAPIAGAEAPLVPLTTLEMAKIKIAKKKAEDNDSIDGTDESESESIGEEL